MPEKPFEFPDVNRTIHEPARLAILTVLSSCASADFLFLQKTTGLSKGNLSVQLTRLEEAGLVYIDKTFKGKKTLTTAELSSEGKRQLDDYWLTMKTIKKRSGRSSY
ncbi:transcriptional regulator [Alloacidobacterium sp.]|uniref:transcriptional regulator n=1 Tax=Alloacidobacterium sp. TaxID=2951999 RepID=UPI002D61F2BF|nr:transcriptional regulator [Alloacidobacterium sp.]HYK34613.1 transcriptional regulator [Alloacidobacterium sp.]